MSKPKRIDPEIIRKFQNDRENKELFDQIYHFYKEQVFLFCLSYLNDLYDSEEVTQEIFLVVYQRIGNLKKIESFDAWLFKVSYLNIINFFRKNKKEENVLEVEIEFDQFQDEKFCTPEEGVEFKYIYDVVKEEIGQLSEKMRGVAYLYYFEEFKISEVAKILGIPTGTVKSRLNKIKKVLQAGLEKKGITKDKYRSIGFLPLLSPVYQQFLNFYKLSPEQNERIIDGISKKIVEVGLIPVGVSSASDLKHKKGIQIGVSIIAGVCTTFLLYLLLNPSSFIKAIEYDKQETRKSLKVEVLMRSVPINKDIQITHNGENLDYKRDGKRLDFVAPENGEYQIRVEETKKEITIDNIDKKAPRIKSVKAQEDGLEMESVDEEGTIDFSNSYFRYEGKDYPITQDGEVFGNFQGEAYVYLQDQVGNGATYQIRIQPGE